MAKRLNKKAVAYFTVGIIFIFFAIALLSFNLLEDKRAGQSAEKILSKIENIHKQDTASTMTIDGETYCGVVKIESLGIELPVYHYWNYSNLKKAPCRYQGSIETDDMIIAGHNYKSHFYKLKDIELGAEVKFLSAQGTLTRYEVKEIKNLDGTAVTDMKAGDWDFSLFTCNRSGAQRVTVRCERMDEK